MIRGDRMMKRKTVFLIVMSIFACCLFITGCADGKGYKTMVMSEAQRKIEEGTDYLIVDVRRQDEYDEGHIPGAVLVPIEVIREGEPAALPDKNRKMMLYCWTGRRSEDSCALLAEYGYTHLINIGGLVDWTGELEKTGADSNTLN